MRDVMPHPNCAEDEDDGLFAAFLLSLILVAGIVAAAIGIVVFIFTSPVQAAQSGIASVYAYKGSHTASGQPARPGGLTAAHRTLPFGTRVRVTNRRNQRSVVVRINDRGPWIRGRVIDVTPAGAHALGFSGLAPVALTVLR